MLKVCVLAGAFLLSACGVTFSPYVGMPFEEFRHQCTTAQASVPHTTYDENDTKMHFCDDRSQQYLFVENVLVEIKDPD